MNFFFPYFDRLFLNVSSTDVRGVLGGLIDRDRLMDFFSGLLYFPVLLIPTIE